MASRFGSRHAYPSCSSPAGSTARPSWAASPMRCWSSSSPHNSRRLGFAAGSLNFSPMRRSRSHAWSPMHCWLPRSVGAICMAILLAFPSAMYPTTRISGMDHLLAITVIAIAWTDIALAALAYHHDVASTVRARSIVEPWTISIVAFVWSYISIEDGLIISYVFSMVAALIAALIPLFRTYGVPHGWKPDLAAAWATGNEQRSAGRCRRGRMGVAPRRSRGPRCVHAGKLRRHLLCRAAGRDPARKAEDQLRAGARPGDCTPDRRQRPCGRGPASAAGHLLDPRRPARHRPGARRFRAAR